MTYKQSRRGNAAVDRIVAHVLAHDEVAHRITPFIPYGYDERQYCSPGFDLPVGCLMRTPNGEYAEYHSSADNLSLLRAESRPFARCIAAYCRRYRRGCRLSQPQPER